MAAVEWPAVISSLLGRRSTDVWTPRTLPGCALDLIDAIVVAPTASFVALSKPKALVRFRPPDTSGLDPTTTASSTTAIGSGWKGSGSMSRSSRQNQRLHFYDLGNDRCPICLIAFERRAVVAGKEVTLEHVPPKGLSTSSIGMCLTCATCNNTAGQGMDQAAVSLARQTSGSIKVRVDMAGTPPMTGYWTRGGNGGLLVRGRLGVEPKITSDTKFQISFKLPEPRVATMSYLRAAYLAVFSLLGPHGYRYAQGKALLRVREQIVCPDEQIIDHFACKVGGFNLPGEAIIMSREKQHWAVKIGNCVVLLPRRDDEGFYEEAEVICNGGHGTINGPVWRPVKFGVNHRGSMMFKDGVDIRAHFGVKNLFGQDGKMIDNNGVEWPFVIADHQRSHATIIAMPAV